LQLVLKDASIDRALVFTRTKHGADRVVRQLGNAGIVAEAIHGNKSQPQRERALAAFKAGTCKVLVATDIAARGIDVSGVSHVINYELPNVPESYVHRIGRTARAGREGKAIAFCAEDERPFLRDIEKLIREKITPLALPADFRAAVVAAQKVERAAPPAPREEERRDFGARRAPGGGRPGRDPRAKVTPHRGGGGKGSGGARQGQNRTSSGGGFRGR
jgi:ATP-dependent RNA helicase RhlE